MRTDFIKQIFLRLNAIYGHSFSSQFKNEEQWAVAELEWGSRLKDILPETIVKVLDNLDSTHNAFPPNLLQIKEMCLKLGMPSWNETLQLALRGDVSNPITAECRKKVGSWLLKTGSQKEVEKAWKEAWYQVVQDLNKKIELRLVNN